MFNQVTLIGQITEDAKITERAPGKPMTRFKMRTWKAYKDEQGRKRYAKEYHTCVSYGKYGEGLVTYLSQGRMVIVEGEMRTRSYQTQGEEKKRYWTEIFIKKIALLEDPNHFSEEEKQLFDLPFQRSMEREKISPARLKERGVEPKSYSRGGDSAGPPKGDSVAGATKEEVEATSFEDDDLPF